MKTTTILTKHGDSTAPISVYAQGRADDIWLSSAGIKINGTPITVQISLGGDDIGIEVTYKKGNRDESIALTINAVKLKVGVETAHITYLDDFNMETTYSNTSITPLGVLALVYAYLTGGEPLPIGAPVYQPQPQPAY